jgi:hypothetical protein
MFCRYKLYIWKKGLECKQEENYELKGGYKTMEYLYTHGPYRELVETGFQRIETKDLNKANIDEHFDAIIAILQDGIETPFVQHMMVNVLFADGVDLDLSIFDYLFNLMFWHLIVDVDEEIQSIHLFYYEDMTKRNIKEYMDKVFVKQIRTKIPFMDMNQIADHAVTLFRKLSQFQMYLSNTVNLEDTIALMNKYPDFNDTIHIDLSGVPMADVKSIGMDATYKQVEYIKNSNHCLRDSFRSGEAVSIKQYKEVAVNIGSKPDGQGGVFPNIINHSFINGGLRTPEELCIESSIGRIAQILQKGNVGESGAFARRLGLNNQDSRIHDDPNYVCDTKNFELVTIKNGTILDMYDMRYYRTVPNGPDILLDADTDKHLIGKTLYFRSPMTCASAARGDGICYRCYGNLAYVNRDINIGQIAAELLSSIYTQILLSAKHLLESKVIKMQWTEGFEDWFEVNFNTIGLYQDKEYRGVKIIIPTDIQNDDEFDDVIYSDYITSFLLKFDNGVVLDIHTSEADPIYIHPDLMQVIKASPDTELGTVIDAHKITHLPILFMINFKNSELSRTMQQIKNLIDNKTTIRKYDRNSILDTFIGTNIEGGIKLNAVHFEVLLMNQIRNAEDILEMPEWNVPNEDYQLITLGDSLTNNRSISIRLQNNKIDRTMINPANRRVTKASNMDVYYMRQPQEYITNKEIVDDSYKLKNDIEDNKICPIYYLNGDAENEATGDINRVTRSRR